MRIGILPSLDPSSGGIYQYSLTMLHALEKWRDEGCEDELIIFADDIDHPTATALKARGWTVKPLWQNIPLKRRAFKLLKPALGEELLVKAWQTVRGARRLVGAAADKPQEEIRYRPEMRRWFEFHGIDLMLYPAPTPLSFESGIPYVMAIHDLQHRLQPEFPEVSADGVWQSREYMYHHGSRSATLILADSEVGKEDILNFYGPLGVGPDRVKVLPFLPANYLVVDIPEEERRGIRAKYSLPDRYLFYPAQFWPHKNHIGIIRALGLLKQRHDLGVPVVLCGSHSGEIRERAFKEAISASRSLGLDLDHEVKYLGYVPDENMSALYAEAEGLIMPTFFGPTNIPVLEAWAFGCPVITSNLRGIREQTGDAAVLVDPSSPESIASGIHQVWTDEGMRQTLILRGKQRLARYTPDDHRRLLIEIVEEAKSLIHRQDTQMSTNRTPTRNTQQEK